MKKQIIALMGVTILSVGMLAGCGGRDNTNSEADSTQEVTTIQDTTNKTTSDNATSESTSEKATTNKAATNNSSGANAEDIISEEEAKNIAIKDAGIREGDITNIRVELDVDDGRKEYEVDFYVENKEYDYTISADDGSILEKDTDIDDDF